MWALLVAIMFLKKAFTMQAAACVVRFAVKLKNKRFFAAFLIQESNPQKPVF